MKKRWIFWWIVTVFWLVIFGIGTAFVWIRDVDGAGVTQTTELKFVAFAVLLIAILIPFIIQMIWLTINLVVGKKDKINIQHEGA